MSARAQLSRRAAFVLSVCLNRCHELRPPVARHSQPLIALAPMSCAAMHELIPAFRKFSYSKAMESLLASLGYKQPSIVQSMSVWL